MAKGFSADYDPQRNYEDLGSADFVMGSPLAQLFWLHPSKWPATVIPEEYRHVQPSEVETLLISGSVDFSTPAEYATHELLPYLKKGHQVIITEAGHTEDLWNTQPKAT